jgi:hypothetical protein
MKLKSFQACCALMQVAGFFEEASTTGEGCGGKLWGKHMLWEKFKTC